MNSNLNSYNFVIYVAIIYCLFQKEWNYLVVSVLGIIILNSLSYLSNTENFKSSSSDDDHSHSHTDSSDTQSKSHSSSSSQSSLSKKNDSSSHSHQSSSSDLSSESNSSDNKEAFSDIGSKDTDDYKIDPKLKDEFTKLHKAMHQFDIFIKNKK